MPTKQITYPFDEPADGDDENEDTGDDFPEILGGGEDLDFNGEEEEEPFYHNFGGDFDEDDDFPEEGEEDLNEDDDDE